MHLKFSARLLKFSFLPLFFSCLLLSFSAFAQQKVVTVSVVNSDQQPIPFATIVVIPAADTLKKINKVTDTKGEVTFKLTEGLRYTLKASSINYVPEIKNILITDNNSFTITIDKADNTLGPVVVTATRPIMRQEDDKTIVDPENLASSSTNAYEILEKTPGLFVDQDGNVYLSSTTPARIYINGREQRMSAADVATMLKSLPPNSIESLEILRTPSAKYDASGGGGIVNVVLKKGVRIGLTGSIHSGFNQGTYGNRFVGLNVNNGSGKLSTYINMQYNSRNSYENLQTDRLFAPDTLLSQNALTLQPGSSYYVGGGLSYQFNKKWEISYDGRISSHNSDNSSVNTSAITKVSTGKLVTSNTSYVDNRSKNTGISQSISTKFKIDSSGSEWTNDFSYNGNPGTSQQDFITRYTIPAVGPNEGDGDIITRFNFVSGASNLLLKLPRKVTIETGIKSTYASFNNSTEYFRMNNGIRTKDAFRTAGFKYKENINAAYFQASKNISGVLVKFGTRLENTNMQGNQLVPKDTSFNIHRTDLFPYVFISRKLMSIMSYELRAYLVYRRTISRPSYELLNPFPRYIDQYLFETGNPALRPQFTQNYEANISVNERPIFAVGINDIKDIFTNVIYQADSSKSLAYRTYDNLGTNKEKYFRIVGAIPPGKKYFVVIGAQYNHNFYQGLYQNKPLSFNRGSWSVFTYQTVKITAGTQLSLNGFARFNGQLQFYELSSFGSMNLSLNQQFLKKKLRVSLSVSDLLFSNNNKFTINQGTMHATGYRESDTRRFGLNLRYNFGFRKKEENNIFNVESPEQKN